MTVEMNPLQPGDSEAVRREKINANFQLLLSLKQDNIISQINSSSETVKIAKSRLAALNIVDDDLQGQLSWDKVNKTGSSLAHLATRSAADLSTGTLPDARLSGNVALLNAAENAFLNGIVIGANIAIAGSNAIYLRVSSAQNKPGLRYLSTGVGTGKWQLSNDGATWNDIGTPTGSGLTSLNGQTGAIQGFGNDDNVVIDSANDTHQIGWQGSLALERGGTGANTAAAARANLGAAALGAENAFGARQLWAKGADIPAAATLNPGGDGNYFIVIGATAITAIANLQAGTIIALEFAGAVSLTNSNNLVLQQGQNYTTEAGDVLVFVSKGGGVWKEISRLSGASIRPTGAIRLDVFANARLVLPVGANKFAQ